MADGLSAENSKARRQIRLENARLVEIPAPATITKNKREAGCL
jgi:hypothetical protein